MTFTARCRAGVIRMMARSPRSASPEKSRGTDHHGMVRLRRSAPTTKSYWSRTGALAPRGLCMRRFRKAPARSPRSAPKARTAEAAKAAPYVGDRQSWMRRLPGFGGSRRGASARPAASRPGPERVRRSPPGADCGRPPAHRARSTGTRSRRFDGPGDRSRSSWTYLCLEVDSAAAVNLPVGPVNPSRRLLSEVIISPPPLYSAIRLVRRPPMDRMKTYVEGFDEALGGGIPRGSLVLVAGTPGTMKTALTFSILYENVKAGSKALSITLEESQE